MADISNSSRATKDGAENQELKGANKQERKAASKKGPSKGGTTKHASEDIDLVLSQAPTGVSRAQAVDSLKRMEGDIVNAIMDLEWRV